MTQQDIHDFMTANGFHWVQPRVASGFYQSNTDASFKINLEEAKFMLRLTLEARRDENLRYKDKSRWYYPDGPEDAYIPVVQVDERLAELNNLLDGGKP